MSNDDKIGISAFEAGMLCALASIRLYLQSRPDWNEDDLNKHLDFFKSSVKDVTDREAFNLPIDHLRNNHANVREAVKLNTWTKKL